MDMKIEEKSWDQQSKLNEEDDDDLEIPVEIV